ncbi:LysR family transcriptional regulator [Sneathiella chinensis]|uniref:Transcriptional regulator n=1 Tax=Sneathiella chinensis TaxID=349750 RepID=A0ABQ5U587_9PROT|nr:LysR family transcriptional regulator [Sneathiella chinensis]GLQ06916.1 transcriptional regulator [Sneathiella chinensis]
MDTRQLRYYAAIFEHRNLSRAASECNVAQSAISHHLSNLETELGVQLFIRKPRGMEPTAAGIKLYEHAKLILRAIGAAEQDMKQLSDEVSGDFAIGLPYSVMQTIALPLMKTVMEDFPKVRLSIVESLSGTNFSNLLASDVDLAFFYNPQKDDRISMVPILEEQVLCVGKRDIVGDTDEPLTFDQLTTLPVLLLRQGVYSRALVDRPALLTKLEAKAPLHLNSVAGIITGLTAGLGCTIAPKVFVGQQLRDGILHARPVIKPSLSRTLYMGHLRERPSTRLQETMVGLLRTLIANEVRKGTWEATLFEAG